MICAMSLAEVAEVTQGVLKGDAEFKRVCTDTRQLQRGDLYVALQGEHFDGHDFAPQAAERGAVAAVVNRFCDAAIPQLKAQDTRLALGLIARANRRNFSGQLVALTGSAGKTTTKELLAAILSEQANVLATRGNLNNEIGVPLTLLGLQADHQYAVIEMGAARSGDIAYLTQFAEPVVTILTNAMPVHLESFGSIETIAKTKGEIFECLPATGVAVINFDDHYYQQWCEQASSDQVLSFSVSNDQADVYASQIETTPSGASEFRLHIHDQSIAICLPLLGQHNIGNALAAAAAAFAVGIDLQQIKAGLDNAATVDGRLKTHQLGNRLLIDDSYNAHPASVQAAIDVLKSQPGPHTLVVGTMAELGESALQGHQQVAEYAAQQCIDQFIAVGEFAETMCEIFNQNSTGKDEVNSFAFTDTEALLNHLKIIQGDSVLVKASRFMKLERVVSKLVEQHHPNKRSAD